jgi:CheY-like chemotaxis protein
VEGPVAGGAAADAVDGRVDEAQVVALARKLRPDVCLVDIRMPGLDGIEVTRALAGPGIADPLRVVIVTTFDTDEYVYGALRAGAAGFLLKDAGPALLIEAVRAAGAGDALISPSSCCGGSPRRPARPPPFPESAVHLAQHGQDPHHPDPGQARDPQPGRTRRLVLGKPDHGKLTVMPRPPSGRAATVSSAP